MKKSLVLATFIAFLSGCSIFLTPRDTIEPQSCYLKQEPIATKNGIVFPIVAWNNITPFCNSKMPYVKEYASKQRLLPCTGYKLQDGKDGVRRYEMEYGGSLSPDYKHGIIQIRK